jgi:signal transduction histidine kinase/CheY-like chemotaxis protein
MVVTRSPIARVPRVPREARSPAAPVVDSEQASEREPTVWPAAWLNELFPFHLVVDGHDTVVALGPSLRKLCPELQPGDPLASRFRLEQPAPTDVSSHERAVFLLSERDDRYQLRGQLFEDGKHTYLLGTPIVYGARELAALGLGLGDFALHDSAHETLPQLRTQAALLEESRAFVQRLTQQRSELRAANKRLSAQFAATRSLAEATALDKAVVDILASVAPALGVPWAVYFEPDEAGALVPRQGWSAIPGVATPPRSLRGSDPLAISLRSGATAPIDALIDLGSNEANILRGEGITWASGVPIEAESVFAGVLAFYGDVGETVDEETSEVLADLAARLSQLSLRLRAGQERDAQANRLADQSEQLAHARDAALDASRLKSTFLASVSHELRTPLSGVVGLANLLVDGALPPAERELAQLLASSANGLRAIIDDILDFSKLDSGRVEVETVELDFASLVEEVTAQFGPAAAARGIDLVCTIDPALAAPISSDPTRLRQVLTNLVANAVKFTHVGSVRVVADLIMQGHSDVVRVEVRDTGIGVDPEHAARLFQPFTQGDGSTTRRYGGTGLGLAICRQLLDLLGGTIALEGAPGVGSTFRFHVPVRLVGEHPLLVEPLRGQVVVVADDREACRTAARHALLAAGAAVVTATLEEARIAAALGPEQGCVLLIGLGHHDEVATLDELAPAYAGTAVLLPPGIANDAVGEIGLVAGAIGHTPVRPSVVVGCVLAALGLEPMAPSISVRPRPSLDDSPRGRALVAEDDPVNQLITSAYLRRLGFAVDVVSDGGAAVEAATDNDYDVLVIDGQMPVLDGLSVARHVRALEGPRGSVRIVALTAGVSADERARTAAAGMDAFVAKPATLEALDAAISPPKQASTVPPPPHLASLPVRRWAVIDRTRLQELLDVDPTGTIGREVVALFRTTVGERLDHSIATAFSAESLAAEAHAIRGAADTVGATTLAQLSRRIETNAHQGNVAEARKLLHEASVAFTQAAQALEHAL